VQIDRPSKCTEKSKEAYPVMKRAIIGFRIMLLVDVHIDECLNDFNQLSKALCRVSRVAHRKEESQTSK